MPVKRRTNKKRAALSDGAVKWLEGRGPSFFQFKEHNELVALWHAYGDATVATWDLGENSKPVASEGQNSLHGINRE